MESDVRNLARHGLVEPKTIEGHSSFSTKVLTLTKDGHWLLDRAQLVSHRQATYHGLVKPKEARHDADLYRLYRQVARDIEDSGGKVRRVVLDFELKKDLYRALSRMRPDKDPRYERIFIANQFDLKVVDGKIPIPDLRIEYEDASPEMKGLQPYWPENLLRRYIRPAAERCGIQKTIGWHTFRHSYASQLKSNGEDVKVVQESLRHANSRITLDTYTQASTPAKRRAQTKVVGMIFPKQTQTANAGGGN